VRWERPHRVAAPDDAHRRELGRVAEGRSLVFGWLKGLKDGSSKFPSAIVAAVPYELGEAAIDPQLATLKAEKN
jgi:hypothetical protein